MLTATFASLAYENKKKQSRKKHIFRVVEHIWQYQKAKYRCLMKNATLMFGLFARAKM